MKDFMALITLNESEEDIKELTYNRPIASIPIGSRYRIIDFILSNLVNTSITNIGIFAQNKYHSVQDHIGSGKDWDLDRKKDGLSLFSPMFDYYTLGIYNGDIENFNTHIRFIHASKHRNVLIAPSNFIYNLNYNEAINHFRESAADITIIGKKVSNINDFIGCHTIDIDSQGNVQNFGINKGENESELISMEVFLMKKSLFLDLIHSSVSRRDSKYIFDAIQKTLGKLKVNTWLFDGYLACINSKHNFFKANMELLKLDVYSDLFFKNGLIFTKVKDEPPSKYTNNAIVSDSLVANGAIIDGTVENSIIFRTVKVQQGASVKNSIVMQSAIVEEGASLNYVILDKNVRITKYKKIEGTEKHPIVIEKNSII